MIDVTILFLDETFSSTAIGPMEVFRHAGRCGISSPAQSQCLSFV